MDYNAGQLIRCATVVFWDFDGVIKASVDVKTNAFVTLFHQFGDDIVFRVREHHETYCGMSRLEKIPLYLQWAGKDLSLASQFCDQFARLVVDEVIKSPWVPGAEDYLRSNSYRQKFVLVSATPQSELEQILLALDLLHCFCAIFGAPVRKRDAIRMTLGLLEVNPEDCLVIGDSQEDSVAAQINAVPFLLRKNSTNAKIFKYYKGVAIDDFVIS